MSCQDDTKINKLIPSSVYYYVLFLVTIALVITVRIRLLSTPLKSDEGEFTYLGQLMLNGVPPYLQAYCVLTAID